MEKGAGRLRPDRGTPEASRGRPWYRMNERLGFGLGLRTTLRQILSAPAHRLVQASARTISSVAVRPANLEAHPRAPSARAAASRCRSAAARALDRVPAQAAGTHGSLRPEWISDTFAGPESGESMRPDAIALPEEASRTSQRAFSGTGYAPAHLSERLELRDVHGLVDGNANFARLAEADAGSCRRQQRLREQHQPWLRRARVHRCDAAEPVKQIHPGTGSAHIVDTRCAGRRFRLGPL